jgi:hypothetical protein
MLFFHNYKLSKLNFQQMSSRPLPFIIFLRNNGKNLRELELKPESGDISSVNAAIPDYCPNLRKLNTMLTEEFYTFRDMLNGCQYLESIGFSFCCSLLLERTFENLAKYSSRYFHELSLSSLTLYFARYKLENFLINWKNRIPLSIIVIVDPPESIHFIKYNIHKCLNEVKKMVEKYKKLGTVKHFEIIKD